MLRQYYSTICRKAFREAQVKKQDSCCAICGRQVKLVVDHDHKSGYMRGMLCRQHNLALGFFGDRPDLLLKAIEYLETHRKKEVEFSEASIMVSELLDDLSYGSNRARARELVKLTGCELAAANSRIQRAYNKRKKEAAQKSTNVS